jgi:hypothetical protein
VPCSDAHYLDTDNNSIVSVIEHQLENSDIDLCSPFCFCECCHKISQPSFYSVVQYHLPAEDLSLLEDNQLLLDFSNLFWHPPKF